MEHSLLIRRPLGAGSAEFFDHALRLTREAHRMRHYTWQWRVAWPGCCAREMEEGSVLKMKHFDSHQYEFAGSPNASVRGMLKGCVLEDGELDCPGAGQAAGACPAGQVRVLPAASRPCCVARIPLCEGKGRGVEGVLAAG
mmetsp:Transcript_29855/g.84150  ORF Transcript_29855/g.84150 Transcript_29855/m.84150 type:complete len:141 (+) Transcript_29855:1224-1646(+)